ncbi:MAG: hypothetical protein WD073_06040 [Xanthobacteraceae bacterium]
MSRGVGAAGIALALLALSAWGSPARANKFPNWVLPSCEAALDEIAAAFREKESRFWNSNLQIVDFTQVHETAFRPWSAEVATRRFCSAEAQVSDGVSRPVYFSIEAGMGEIGATWGVQWCVVGLDRNWAYNPSCRMARP